MFVEIVSTGDELLVGEVVNTNASWIAKRLTLMGFTVRRITVVGDSVEEISDVLKNALSRADIVIVTGGLGPTRDDVTREAVARVTGRRLVLHRGVLEELLSRRRCEKEAAERMATVVDGCRIIPNSVGAAPGMVIEYGSKLIICLPGPPHELKPMFSRVEDELKKFSGGTVLVEKRIKVKGLPEICVYGKVSRILEKVPGVYIKTRVLEKGVEVYFLGRREDVERAVRMFDHLM
ncbi:MAG TPA: competence/damage-inducible protein A [Thermoprotei archaeon]|nr:competence/damage-inducible protein A [Thermoprotei archaeon]